MSATGVRVAIRYVLATHHASAVFLHALAEVVLAITISRAPVVGHVDQAHHATVQALEPLV